MAYIMMSSQGISVVIPVFNRAYCISQTLQSIFTQSVPVDAVIVVDDGSTDGIRDVIERMSFISPIPLIFHRQENLGPGRARNVGVSMAKSNYILFLDSDDELLPNSIERFQKAIVENNFPNMVFGGRITLLPNRKSHLTSPPPLSKDNWINFRGELLSLRPTVGIGAAVIQREFIHQLPFPETFRVCEDLAFYSLILLHGRCVRFSEAQVRINQRTHHSFRDANLLLIEHENAYAFPLKKLPNTPEKIQLQNELRALPLLRTFRELHRAGADKMARSYYYSAFRVNPWAALNISYLRKFLRGLLGIKHPAANNTGR